MKKKKEFSKKILVADYLIALLIVIFLIICSIKNYIYVSNIQRTIIETGCQISIIYPYDLTNLTIILTAWIGQLGISSTAYYIMCKSDQKVQLGMGIVRTMADNIKDRLDMTAIVTTVLNATDN